MNIVVIAVVFSFIGLKITPNFGAPDQTPLISDNPDEDRSPATMMDCTSFLKPVHDGIMGCVNSIMGKSNKPEPVKAVAPHRFERQGMTYKRIVTDIPELVSLGWMKMKGVKGVPEFKDTCFGSLIHVKGYTGTIVLTTAQCIEMLTNELSIQKYGVKYAILYDNVGSEKAGEILDWKINKDYVYTSNGIVLHDVAIAKLDEIPSDGTHGNQRFQLPEENAPAKPAFGVHVQKSAEYTYKITKVLVTYVEEKTCQNHVEHRLLSQWLQNAWLCTEQIVKEKEKKEKRDQGKRDTFLAGSPLFSDDKVIQGVSVDVNHQLNKGKISEVTFSANVAHYTPWIQSVVQTWKEMEHNPH